ncbi:hypothetical protein DMA11_06825 [Marinilabiliaceae bacterium JC017]|nr:hypothetical protein DMA11_06825 [Marinilabiliaceae bacterium JC017]
MKPISTNIKGYDQVNPFKDSQARNFSNQKLIAEFCPTKFYWDLFNDQHEILIGTRGSGKTILLRMMQYSLLKQIKNENADEIIKQKKYIPLYVPTNIEFLRSINPVGIEDEQKILFFQFGFNCLLAQTLIKELKSIIADIESDLIQRVLIEEKISEILSSMWFEGCGDLDTLDAISFKIDSIYHNFNFFKEDNIKNVPPVFINTIGKPVQSISKHIYKILKIETEPIWLICIDEAEFLDISHQKCINTLFRADSQGIVVKMATLPFKHKTRETFVKGELAEPNGNDFNYRNIEFDPLGTDFVKLTNQLCNNRISKTLKNGTDEVTLENFIGIVGQDSLVDYYCKETKIQEDHRNIIEKGIIDQLSAKRKETALQNGIGSKENRKPIYDKFAPIFFIREMHKLSKKGGRVPGFYAGANTIRKLSEGNPRIFIQIMNQLFEKARTGNLNEKQQHIVLTEFAKQHCEITERLPEYGNILAEFISNLSDYLFDQTHSYEIKDTGTNFKLGKRLLDDSKIKNAIMLGCAYSRLKIDENSLLNAISANTILSISNVFALKYWIPMRKSGNDLRWDGLNKNCKKQSKDDDAQNQIKLLFE